jgi:hypothetical protein
MKSEKKLQIPVRANIITMLDLKYGQIMTQRRAPFDNDARPIIQPKALIEI